MGKVHASHIPGKHAARREEWAPEPLGGTDRVAGRGLPRRRGPQEQWLQRWGIASTCTRTRRWELVGSRDGAEEGTEVAGARLVTVWSTMASW